jgi:predicted DsbA family dithiol-disulfide isomerase
MRIDYISDISCPWCALGLASLEKALSQLGDEIPYELHFQPFELNPEMPPEGKDLTEYLSAKYGMSAEQVDATHENLRQRGLELGFIFGKRERIWNTFDAHRLLYWADISGVADAQRKLKLALMHAYQTERKNPGDHLVLLALAVEAGLDQTDAKTILQTDAFANEVRNLEREWHLSGINAVPSLVINQQHLLQGAQPVELLVSALRELNGKTAT